MVVGAHACSTKHGWGSRGSSIGLSEILRLGWQRHTATRSKLNCNWKLTHPCLHWWSTALKLHNLSSLTMPDNLHCVRSRGEALMPFPLVTEHPPLKCPPMSKMPLLVRFVTGSWGANWVHATLPLSSYQVCFKSTPSNLIELNQYFRVFSRSTLDNCWILRDYSYFVMLFYCVSPGCCCFCYMMLPLWPL